MEEEVAREGRREGLIHVSALPSSAVRTSLAHRLPYFLAFSAFLYVGMAPMNTTVLDQSATTVATGHSALSGWSSWLGRLDLTLR